MGEWWQDLGNAIVLQAVKDYRKLKAVLQKYPKYKPALEAAKEIEEFFISSWFDTICQLDGKSLLQRLQREG